MATTNITIQGVSASGSGGNGGGNNNGGQNIISPQNNVVNTPPSSSGAGSSSVGGTGWSLPSNERMIEDIRREMRQRGVMLVPGSQSMHKIIDEYAQTQKRAAEKSIGEKYDTVSTAYEKEQRELLNKKQKERLLETFNEYEQGGGNRLLFEYSTMYDQAKRENEREEREVNKRIGEKNDEILAKENAERTQVDKELNEAIRTLTAYFEREAESGANSSYLGRLKEERKQLILERDSATTEEGAIAAQMKLNDVNGRISKILNPRSKGDEDMGDMDFNSLMMSQGLSSMFSSFQQGDIAGSAMGLGTAVTSALGVSRAVARKALGWIGLAVGGAKGVMDAFRQNDDIGELIAVLGGVGTYDYDTISNNMNQWSYGGLKYQQMGLGRQDFSQLAVNYSNALGVKNANNMDWFNHTIALAATEKEYGLSRGQLAKLAKYGRYNDNGELINSAYSLGGLLGQFEGFTGDDHSNAQTILDAYSSILQSYSNRTNNPNYYDAANTIFTLSSIFTNSGNHFDERTAGEIATFQNLIQNPANDRMQALIYGKVGEMIGTNDLSKIDKYILDPENEVNVMRNVISEISNLYGGPESEMGYWAFKQLLPNMAPERRTNYINALMSGKNLNKSIFEEHGQQNVNYSLGTAEKYTSDVTSAVLQIKESAAAILRKLVELLGE